MKMLKKELVNKMEEIEVNTIEIDGKKYIVLDEIKNEIIHITIYLN